MVLGRKTNFFLGKTKKTMFLEFGRIVSQKMFFLFFFGFSWEKVGFLPKTFVFLGQSWFSCPKPSFPRKKIVFLSKTIFFLRKKLVFPSKTIFFQGKTQKTIFLVSDRIVSQKMVFFGFPYEKVGFPSQNHFFPGKKLVFHAKTTFFLRNLGISLQDQAFPSKECVFHVLFARVTNYSAVNIKFQCHHYCDSSPLSVSTIQ